MEKGESALLTGGSNRFYLTGFDSSAGTVVLTRSRAVFLIDFRYFEKAKGVVGNMEVMLAVNANKQIGEILKQENITKLYTDISELTVDRFLNLKTAFKGVEVLSDDKIDKAVLGLRAVKSRSEIKALKTAQSITDKAFSYILEKIEIGKTEKEIELDLEFFARKNGSEGVAFDFIVVSGENSSLPHGVPTDRKLRKGDFITMDFGAKFGGYCSDMTRTVAIGEISEQQKEVYYTVLKGQELAFNKIKSGAVCKDVDKAAREYIESRYPNAFGHGLGHSLGIDIHENPAFNTRDNTILKSGTVMTVEPGIYLENKFGVRIEDTVIVTEEGYENITESPKDLIIL